MWNSWDSNSRVSLFQIKMGVFIHYKSSKEAEHEVWQNLAAFLTYPKRKKNKHPALEVFFWPNNCQNFPSKKVQPPEQRK
jgi:hypothetical protein